MTEPEPRPTSRPENGEPHDRHDRRKAQRRSAAMAVAIALATTPHSAAHLTLNAAMAHHGLGLWIAPLIGLETAAVLLGCHRPPWAWARRARARRNPPPAHGTGQHGTGQHWTGQHWTGQRWLSLIATIRAAIPMLMLLGPTGWLAGQLLNGTTRPAVQGSGLAMQARYDHLRPSQLRRHQGTLYAWIAVTATLGGYATTHGPSGWLATALAGTSLGLLGALMLARHPWSRKLPLGNLRRTERNEQTGTEQSETRRQPPRALRHGARQALSPHGRALTGMAFIAAGGVAHGAHAADPGAAAGIATATAWLGAGLGSQLGRTRTWQRIEQAWHRQRPTSGLGHGLGHGLAVATLLASVAAIHAIPPAHTWLATGGTGIAIGAWIQQAITASLGPGTSPDSGTDLGPLPRALRTLEGQACALLAWSPAYAAMIATLGWTGYALTAAGIALLPTLPTKPAEPHVRARKPRGATTENNGSRD